MKICLVATFPPSGRQLNEYAYYIARELQANPEVARHFKPGELEKLCSLDFHLKEVNHRFKQLGL